MKDGFVKVGCDVEEVARFSKLAPALCRRLFSKRERDYCAGKPHPAGHLAARFAAKEALFKATGKHFDFASVEILDDAKGAPCAYINGKLQKKTRVSLSHSRSVAMAVVLAE